MSEIWKPIPGWPMYEASSLGNIRNVFTKHVLRARTHSSGYRMVDLHSGARYGLSVAPKQTPKLVHGLVCSAFHGRRPAGHVVAHNNGIPSDNRAENVRWDTQSGNNADKKLHGTNNHGAANGSAKLSEEQAKEIISLGRTGLSQSAIGQRFGISPTQVGKIIHGKKWSYLQTV